MRITNRSRSPLALVAIGVIAPGESKEVGRAQLDQAFSSKIAQRWYESGLVEVNDGETEDLDGGEYTAPLGGQDGSGAEELAEKQELIEALAEYGIVRDHSASVESLRELLADAEAE